MKLKLSQLSLPYLLGLCALLALVLEGLAFNHFYFRFHMGDYQTQTVSIPYNEDVKGNGILLDPNNKQVSLGSLDLPLFSVGFSVVGPGNRIDGSIYIVDDANQASPLGANVFAVVPDLKTPAQVRSLVTSKGNAHAIAISLDNLKTQAIITEVVLNPQPNYVFYWTRFALMALIFMAGTAVFKLQLYRYRLSDLGSKGQLILNCSCAAFCLSIAVLMFQIVSPKNLSPELLYDFNEKGFVFLGNQNQSYLLDYPKTREELVYHDPYVKTMDAFNKGQLHFDVDIDLKLMEMEYPYDYSDRTRIGAQGYWDHSYYKGKYYAYYGYGPVFTLYYPIYWLTGKVAAPSVTNLLATVLCMLGFFYATSGVRRFTKWDSNAMLWALSQCSLLIGSYILYCELLVVFFYGVAPLLAAFYLLLLVGLVYRLPQCEAILRRRLFLAASGLCVVMIVLCRPHALIYAMIFTVPVFWQMFIARKSAFFEYQSWRNKNKLIDLACIAVPVALGAVFTMYTNYARFESVFEFGQTYCTGIENFLYNNLDFSLDMMSHTVYYYFFAGFELLKTFPYVALTNGFARDFGNYFFGNDPLSVFASPLYLYILLFVCVIATRLQLKDSYEELVQRNLRLVMLLSLIAMPVIFYVQLRLAAYTARYSMETMLALAPFVLVCLMRYVPYEESFAGKLWYGITCICAIKSLMLGIFITFSIVMNNHSYVAPDTFISLAKFFSPLTTLY